MSESVEQLDTDASQGGTGSWPVCLGHWVAILPALGGLVTGAVLGFQRAAESQPGPSPLAWGGIGLAGASLVGGYFLFRRTRPRLAGGILGGLFGIVLWLTARLFGDLTWPTYFSVAILSLYAGSVWVIDLRLALPANRIRRIGLSAWWPVGVVAVGGFTPMTVCFLRDGFVAAGPWLTVWLTLWLLARTIYFAGHLRGWPAEEMVRYVTPQLWRGALLLQGALLTGFLPTVWGVAAFAGAFGLFWVAKWRSA